MRLAPAPDLERLTADVEALARFRDERAPGWTRRVFSEEYRAAKEWLAGRMEDAGLEVEVDAAVNLIGTRPGGERLGGALVTGSHTDTVHGGGRFDGIIGVLGAIESARCLRDAGTRLRHDLRVVDFTGEEPNDYGLSCVGSRAIAGQLEPAHLGLCADGSTLGEALRRLGGDPDAVAAAAWAPQDVAAFVELHIEQGPVLERREVPVGVVTGIAGIHRVVLTFEGRPDHAGTTPMDARRDALCAAAEAIVALERAAAENGGVATTGRIAVQPGASNVVPGWARIWTEFRSVDPAWLTAFQRVIDERATAAASPRGVTVQVEAASSEHPVPADPRVTTAITAALDRLDLPRLELPSGAGHDAVFMAALGPVGMIFVPSRDGRSHAPEEWTDPDQVALGVHALTQTLLELDSSADRKEPS